MAASYPTSVAVFTTKQNIIDIIDASHPNNIQEEVVAIESILGVNPNLSTSPSAGGTFAATATSFGSVSARLANIEIGVVSDAHSQYIRKAGDSANIIVAGSAATKGLIVRGAASQSASLQEWQTSAGTAVTTIGSDGTMTTVAPASSGYVRTIHVSTSTPTGGNDGDVWLKYT